MYKQEEYIYNEFTKHYTDIHEPIAIYGIGIDAGNLLPQISQYNIVGLLDGKVKSGEAHGKRIIDLPQVLEQKVKTIVIVARPAVLNLIYHRIASFAEENNIFVGDVRGRNLSEEFAFHEHDIEYFDRNWTELEDAVKKYDIVTFDIFDTLLVRKTLLPKDIFEVTELKLKDERERIPDFCSIRIEAEDRCYKKGLNPDIYQIYEEICNLSECPTEVSRRYLQTEIETEREFLCARKSMLDFYNKIKKEKEIYLISDMYLPSDILNEILGQCGYMGYKKIYVSCEHGCGKADGLFEKFICEEQIKTPVIHIGDNEITDKRCAEAAGLHSFYIMNKMELMENSTYNMALDRAESLLDHITLGMFANKAFDDPFILHGTRGKREISDHREMAYLFLAPEIIYFVCWLMKSIENERCDYVIYPSRDAYVLKKLCAVLKKNQNMKDFPDGVYTYVSRRALLAACTFEKDDIDYVLGHDYRGDTLGIFKDRFNIKLDERAEGYSRDAVMEFSRKYSKEILDRCSFERNNYMAYLDNLNLEKKEKIAFIDFVAAGTVQNGLRKLISTDIKGFYFLKRNTDDVDREKHINVESFYTPKGDFELDANVYRFYLFLEMLLTSPEPTLNYMDEKRRPVFLEEKRSRREIQIIMDMQEEILNFGEEVSRLHPSILAENIKPDMADKILGFIGNEFSDIKNNDILSMQLTDEYMARTFNIFDR